MKDTFRINYFYVLLGISFGFLYWGIQIVLSHGWGWIQMEFPITGIAVGVVVGVLLGKKYKKPALTQGRGTLMVLILFPLMLGLPIIGTYGWLSWIARDLPIHENALSQITKPSMHAEGFNIDKSYHVEADIEEVLEYYQNAIAETKWETYANPTFQKEPGSATRYSGRFVKGSNLLFISITNLQPGTNVFDPGALDTGYVWVDMTILVEPFRF